MILKKNLFTSTAFLFFALLQPVQSETLETAVSHAIKHHPSVKASYAAEKAAKQDIVEEKSAYYPTATVSANFGRLYADNTTTRGLTVTRGAGYSWFGEGNGRLTQTLYDWSARAFAVKSAEARYESLKASKTGAQQAIAIEAATAYTQLLRATQLLGEAMSYEQEMVGYYDRIKTSFDNGGADESEVSRAQDFLSLANNLVLQYESDRKVAEADYLATVGYLPETAMLMPSPERIQLPETADEAVALALSLNAQLNAAEQDKRASEFAMKQEKKNMLPVFDAELSALKRDQDDVVGGETEDVRALVRASWDYSFGGAQKAAQRRAAMQAEESAYNYEATERAIERDIHVAWVAMTLAGSQKTNQSDRLNASEKTLETYKEQYEGGQQSLLEMMSAKASLFAARQDYLNATYQELNAIYTVMGLIGMPFYEADVMAQGEVYDAAE